MNTQTVTNANEERDLEFEVKSADPHKLISMLYEGAILAINNAKKAIADNDISAKGTAISKAIAIINEGLNASLDKKVGGELAKNLESLYEYMSMRLITANLKNDIAMLDEVAYLLNDLKSAWDEILQTSTASGIAVQVNAASNVQPL